MLKIKEEYLKEIKMIVIVLVILIFILKIVFYKESLIVISKLVFSLFWTFMLPGYLIIYYWHSSIDVIERLVISFPIGAAIVGIISYYLGIMGVHTRIHHILIPIFIIIIFIISLLFKRKFKSKFDRADKPL